MPIEKRRYDAYYVPNRWHDGYNTELVHALDWLGECDYSGRRLIVLSALKMVFNHPLLEAASHRFDIVSPRSRARVPPGPGPVLALWPDPSTLSFAEEHARHSALCVVPGFGYDAKPWLLATKAFDVSGTEGFPEDLRIDARLAEVLRQIDSSDGHNNFAGAGGKAYSVRRLRLIRSEGIVLDPEAIEAWLLAYGRCRPKGAARVATWVRELNADKKSPSAAAEERGKVPPR